MNSPTISNPRLNADDFNNTGCDLYRKNLLQAALACYNNAIKLDASKFAFYFNRCACLMKLSNYTAALEDAKLCVDINPRYVKAYELQAKCLIALGLVKDAKHCIECISQLDENNSFVKTEKEVIQQCSTIFERFQYSLKSKDFISTLEAINNLLQYANHSINLKVIKAGVLLSMERFEEAESIVNDILLVDCKNYTAYYYRGNINYVKQQFDAAIRDFEASLSLEKAPTFRNKLERLLKISKLRVAKSGARDAIDENDWNKALNLYSEAIQIDPANDGENSKLYFNISIVAEKLRNLEEAIDNCSKAIELDPNYLKAYLRRAQLYRDLKRFEESIRDYEKVIELEPLEEEYYDLLDATRNELCERLASQVEQETLSATLALTTEKLRTEATEPDPIEADIETELGDTLNN